MTTCLLCDRKVTGAVGDPRLCLSGPGRTAVVVGVCCAALLGGAGRLVQDGRYALEEVKAGREVPW